ncbi:MAG TPA: LLM class flavin-dependent oxidoreductase [Anaerolineales bacterium]|nr:LLM class flavin-dependent oxidoreductase [Anaerolineales bacterium]
MKYGLYLPNFGAFADARLLADLAHDAEQAGWKGLFLWDHIARSWTPPVVDTWVALSAIALNTTNIRFGPLVTPLPRRRPWKVARETASLDQLSAGRLILGVGTGGLGGLTVEWANLGEELDLRTRAEMLDEGLEILMGLWSGKPFAFSGKHYQVRDSQFTPTPIQSPRIPIWVGGNWPHKAPFRRAARWDGMMPQVDLKQGNELVQLRQAIQYTLEQRKSNTAYEVVYSTHLDPGGDPARLAERIAQYTEAGITWLLEQLYPQHFGGDWQGNWPVEAMRQRILQGPPTE